MPVASKKKKRPAPARPEPGRGDRKPPIKSADALTDHVCEYMHDHHKALSIDTVLTRPLDALRMGLTVAEKSQRITEGTAKKISLFLESLAREPAAMDAIDDVCRAALNGRKHGDIRRDRY